MMTATVHRRLDCGIDFAAEPLANRQTVSLHISFRSGTAYEPQDQLGVARLVEQTLSKGTTKHDGRGLSDAFDALGIQRASGTGRETIVFRCTCLPEFLGQAVELYAEMLATPTFPEDACRVAVDLALQELAALQDDPMDLARKLVHEQAYGPRLGRDPLGCPETLARIARAEIEAYWTGTFSAERMQVIAAGALDADRLADQLERIFEGFGRPGDPARDPIPLVFTPCSRHHPKDQEQNYIMLCWPGLARTDPQEQVERVMVNILSGGMSGRLFTEVREKQGLVYWVGAWLERPRGSGMIHIGASTTPERCDRTYATLLREVDRLAEDVTEDELHRAIIGITARKERESDLTHVQVSELADDLFYFGRPIPVEEKLAKVRSVTISDIRCYLESHPRERLSVLTLGPRQLNGGP
jgi:predicted Zn-dependent peptidase